MLGMSAGVTTMLYQPSIPNIVQTQSHVTGLTCDATADSDQPA